MKLRIRCVETKETTRIQAPSPCSLHHLKLVISQTLPSFSPPSSIHLSLNQRDPLISSSPEDQDTLPSLGISPGDLIYFTLNPTLFPHPPNTQHHQNTETEMENNDHPQQYLSAQNPPNPISQQTLISKMEISDEKHISGQDPPNPISQQTLVRTSPRNEYPESRMEIANEKQDVSVQDPSNLISQQTLVSDFPRNQNPQSRMEIDDEEQEQGCKVSTAGLVQTHNLDSQQHHKIEAKMEIDDDQQDVSVQDPFNPISQQTLIPDSPRIQKPETKMEVCVGKSFSVPGFLRQVFTDELGDAAGGNHDILVIAVHAVLLESGFVSKLGFRVCPSLLYTLPGINDDVIVKFQSIGSFFSIYGCLSDGKGAHFVTVDEEQLVPFLNVVWANCDSGSSSTRDEVSKFWRTVKDKLALPLLIDLCEKAGLGLPPCFARLPNEVKLKIFEMLPGLDIAKVACVSSELRYLTSSEDLWKKKFRQIFGSHHEFNSNWKEKFGIHWSMRRERMLLSNVGLVRSTFSPRRFPPAFIGGNHDIWPQGVDPLAPLLRPFRGNRGRSTQQWRHCNLGGGHNLP